MSGEREILIYPGSPKTGTSALQAVLRCSVEQLKDAGWNYLHDPVEGDPDALGSGNAVLLFAALAGLSDEDPVAEFERLAPPGERSIIASEVLSGLLPEQWSPVTDLLEEEGSTIRGVYCVRDLYPFCWSAYNQVTSVFRSTKEFDVAWVSAKKSPVPLSPKRGLLQKFRMELPDSPCVMPPTYLHYETIRRNVIEEMLRAGGIPIEACQIDLARSPDRPVNRSLSQPEIALMRRINASTDEFRAQWSGLTLTKRPSPKPIRPVYVPEVHQWLVDTQQERLDRFNDDLPPGTDWKLKIFDDSAYDYEEIDPHPEESPEFADAIYYLLSFEPSEDYREMLISFLPGGVYDPPPSPGRLRRVASRAKRALAPS